MTQGFDPVAALKNEAKAKSFRPEYVTQNIELAAAQFVCAVSALVDPERVMPSLLDRLEVARMGDAEASVQSVLTDTEKAMLPDFEVGAGLVFDAAFIQMAHSRKLQGDADG